MHQQELRRFGLDAECSRVFVFKARFWGLFGPQLQPFDSVDPATDLSVKTARAAALRWSLQDVLC